MRFSTLCEFGLKMPILAPFCGIMEQKLGKAETIAVLLVNSRSRSLYAIARPSVVCNVRAPYSDG